MRDTKDLSDDDKIINFLDGKNKIENDNFFSVYATKENLEMLERYRLEQKMKILDLQNIKYKELLKKKKCKNTLTALALGNGACVGLAGACFYVGATVLNGVFGLFNGIATIVGGGICVAISAALTAFTHKYGKLYKVHSKCVADCQDYIDAAHEDLKYTEQEIESCKFYIDSDKPFDGGFEQ